MSRTPYYAKFCIKQITKLLEWAGTFLKPARNMAVSHQFLTSSIYQRIAQIGLSARALVYWLVAGLMLKAAMLESEPDSGMGPTEAFRSLESTGAGRLLLLTIGAGLLLYAGWRWTQAMLDVRDEGNDVKGLLARGGMAMSGISYTAVAAAAITVTLGANSGGGPGATETALRWLLDMPLGRFLVVLPGLVFIGIGAAQIWRGIDGRWADDLEPGDWETIGRPLTYFAIVGRGLLFGLIGVFAVLGGLGGDPEDARGLAETMGWLRQLPFGLWLYLTGAAIIGAYGFYSSFQAAYLRFRT